MVRHQPKIFNICWSFCLNRAGGHTEHERSAVLFHSGRDAPLYSFQRQIQTVTLCNAALGAADLQTRLANGIASQLA